MSRNKRLKFADSPLKNMGMSKDKKKIYKPSPISGFPEWLPEVRMVEQQWLDHIRRTFESYGFASIETPAVEELNVIAAKGEDVDKEIYVLERLQAEEPRKTFFSSKPEDPTKFEAIGEPIQNPIDDNEALQFYSSIPEGRIALHFDQTVPFARYVAQHFQHLVFPFKRYQMQKVWRGERPQAGRMREFYQCDIDIINPDNLPISFDADMPAIIWETLTSLPGMENENIQIRVSNRKILIGFLNGLWIPDKDGGDDYKLSDDVKTQILRDIDKLEKIGKETLLARLDQTGSIAGIGFRLDSYIKPFIDICETKIKTSKELEELYDQLVLTEGFDTTNETLKEGISELSEVLDNLSHLPEGAVVADLSIVRGLDYYTGTVYETVFVDDPTYGSICSGGRYDDLAGSYINKHLPGVGISIGFSRLFDRLRNEGKLPVTRKCPTDVLILPPRDEADITKMREVEQTLRKRKNMPLNVEIAHGKKLQKQMAYAEKKGIPFVWFAEDGQVKDMITGEQTSADAASWNPYKEH